MCLSLVLACARWRTLIALQAPGLGVGEVLVNRTRAGAPGPTVPSATRAPGSWPPAALPPT